jgi:hypothetical protein
MQFLLLLLVLSFLAFVGFVIYFIFKILQFVIQAANLYKKIMYREEAIIKILLDIRDNTKNADISVDSLDELPPGPEGNNYCPYCQKYDSYFDSTGNLFCPNCQKVLDPAQSKRKRGEPSPQPQVTVCSKCGKHYEGNLSGEFCELCGSKFP